jgi:hypothetical protein
MQRLLLVACALSFGACRPTPTDSPAIDPVGRYLYEERGSYEVKSDGTFVHRYESNGKTITSEGRWSINGRELDMDGNTLTLNHNNQSGVWTGAAVKTLSLNRGNTECGYIRDEPAVVDPVPADPQIQQQLAESGRVGLYVAELQRRTVSLDLRPDGIYVLKYYSDYGGDFLHEVKGRWMYNGGELRLIGKTFYISSLDSYSGETIVSTFDGEGDLVLDAHGPILKRK